MTLKEASKQIRVQIGETVRAERQRRGWSLLQVSRETGGIVPRYAVDRIENGEMRDVAAIVLVMAALGFELPFTLSPSISAEGDENKTERESSLWIA